MFKNAFATIYKALRKSNLNAKQAFIMARHHARYDGPYTLKREFGVTFHRPRFYPYSEFFTDKEVITLEGGYSLEFKVVSDTDSPMPWKEFDGFGVVVSHRTKDDEAYWPMSGDWYYDVHASKERALEQDWDTAPYRTGTLDERAARAIKADYDHISKWLNGNLYYVWVRVTLQHPSFEDEEVYSCGDIENTSVSDVVSEVRSITAHTIKKHRKAKAQAKKALRIANRFSEAMENAL